MSVLTKRKTETETGGDDYCSIEAISVATGPWMQWYKYDTGTGTTNSRPAVSCRGNTLPPATFYHHVDHPRMSIIMSNQVMITFTFLILI